MTLRGFGFWAAILLVVASVVGVALSMHWLSGWNTTVLSDAEGGSMTSGGTSVAAVSATADVNSFCPLSREAKNVSHNGWCSRVDSHYSVGTNSGRVGCGLLVSRYKLVLEELSRAHREVEALKLLVEKLYVNYTALSRNYTSVLEAYSTLRSEFQRVIVKLAAAEENLTRLARDYLVLFENYTRLRLEYNRLLEAYEEALEALRKLNASYNKLVAEYQMLLRNYTLLWENYTRLLKDYEKLAYAFETLFNQYVALHEQCTSSSNVYFVMLGVPTCPHCRAMVEFFADSGFQAYFCNLQESSACSQAFSLLYSVRVTVGVPTIIACTSAGILFIEVGEYTNETWWFNAIASHEPIAEGAVPVYYGSTLKTYYSVTPSVFQMLCIGLVNESNPIGR